MCNFFSFNTEPEYHGGQRFYFDWDKRKTGMEVEVDSHSTIAKHFGLNEDICNKYEYNCFTSKFRVDQINSEVDDSLQAEEWVRKLGFKKVIEPLIIKPIVHPFELPKVEMVTDEHIEWLKQWIPVRFYMRDFGESSVRASVRDSVWNSVWNPVWDSVRASVWASVRASVWASVRASVWASVGDSARAYVSSFFSIKYDYDFTPCVKLWEAGLVPSFDGTTWRLHSGKNADVVYEWKVMEVKNE